MHPDRAVAVVSLPARIMLFRLVWSGAHSEKKMEERHTK